MRVSIEYYPFLQKFIGTRCIAESPPFFFVPMKIKSAVDRAAKLDSQKAITKDTQRVCPPE